MSACLHPAGEFQIIQAPVQVHFVGHCITDPGTRCADGVMVKTKLQLPNTAVSRQSRPPEESDLQVRPWGWNNKSNRKLLNVTAASPNTALMRVIFNCLWITYKICQRIWWNKKVSPVALKLEQRARETVTYRRVPRRAGNKVQCRTCLTVSHRLW